jgi:hypothetical protein
MKMLLIPAILASAAWALPARPRGAEIIGPKAFIIGDKCSGAVSSSTFAFAGFAENPVVDVHTTAAGVAIRDLVVTPKDSGSGMFRFSIEYTPAAPPAFDVIIIVTGGTGSTGGGAEKFLVNVRKLQ